ncbi:hypothetical protein N4T77_02695 [Clostridium sp. CX1]|uniref:hypothetical protein n=1 Tax=Clostridium sp. CX1 TaxID=2978346 RepID=UPI0021C20FFA|nr:hypothetical protein [Clostridium sp. CX1]MCT8975499.1 hypothetical protein [Clostridium sp. CX1]
MNFKEQLKKDLDIFINVNEFADLHILDGLQIPVIIDSDAFEKFSSTEKVENAMQGVFQSTLTIYVKSTDCEKPNLGYRLQLDGEYYHVIDVFEADGLIKINLMSNEG